MKNNDIKVELRIFKVRGESFPILFHYYVDNGVEFTTPELNDYNLNQAYMLYRIKHFIPFNKTLDND